MTAKMVKPVSSSGEQSSPSHRTNRLRAENAVIATGLQRSQGVVNAGKGRRPGAQGTFPAADGHLVPGEA